MSSGSNEHFCSMTEAISLSILQYLSQATPLWTGKHCHFTHLRLPIHREECQLLKHVYLGGPRLYLKENKNRNNFQYQNHLLFRKSIARSVQIIIYQ